METYAATHTGYSRRLPPPEAWKNPGKWIDPRTGLARANTPKLVLPTDYLGFVKPDEAIDLVIDYYFWDDYDWPYDQYDPQTALDRHHFQHRAAAYAPHLFNGSAIPSKVREFAPHIGLIPRQLHNTLHDFTAEPIVPEFDALESRYDSFTLAHRAFTRLINSAKGVSHASSMFSRRAASIRKGAVVPNEQDDVVIQEMMIDFYKRHFTEYGYAVEDFLKMEGSVFVPQIEDKTLFDKPHLLVKRLGKMATRAYINLTPLNKAA